MSVETLGQGRLTITPSLRHKIISDAAGGRRLTYRGAHSAVVRQFGSASAHRCSAPGCTASAQAWAYRGGAGDAELTETVNGSTLRYTDRDLDRFYVPACHLHHVRADTVARRGRCKRQDAEAFVLHLIDRHGQFLLSRRIYAEADARGIDRFTLRAVRDRFGIESRMFHNVDGAGSVAVWLVPDEAVPAPGRRTAGTS